MSSGVDEWMWILVVVGVPGLLSLAAWFQVAEYRVQRHWLEVRFRGWCVRKYPFQDIAGIEQGGFFPAAFWPTRWFLGRNRLVTVHLRSGWPRRVVITPEDPGRFCRDFRFSLGRLPKSEDPQSSGAG